MTSLDFLKALSVLGYLILLMKRELNIQTPCGISLSIITTKTPFLSSLLISLRCKSIKGVSCTRTDISACRDCLADMPVGLTDIPAELTDMPAEVMWFSIAGFLFAGYFRGRPQLRFIGGSASSVGFWGTSGVGKGASSSFNSAVASGSSGSAVASSSSSLTSWVFSGRK